MVFSSLWTLCFFLVPVWPFSVDVNDVFRQSAELFWLAVTGLLFAAMDIYMFISEYDRAFLGFSLL